MFFPVASKGNMILFWYIPWQVSKGYLSQKSTHCEKQSDFGWHDAIQSSDLVLYLCAHSWPSTGNLQWYTSSSKWKCWSGTKVTEWSYWSRHQVEQNSKGKYEKKKKALLILLSFRKKKHNILKLLSQFNSKCSGFFNPEFYLYHVLKAVWWLLLN